MSYAKRKGRRGERKFSQLYDDMSKSKAFRQLSGSELKILMYFISEYNGTNNGNLDLSYEKAEEYLYLTTATYSKGLKSLEQKGFIKKAVQGRKGILSRYAVTCYPVDDIRDQHGVKTHYLPVSPIATNDWREYNKTLHEDKARKTE